MPPQIKKRKRITLMVNGVAHETQVTTARVVNNTEDGEVLYTYAPDGEVREEADPNYALELTYFANWTVTGISWLLSQLDGQTVDFSFTDYPDDPAWTVTREGQVKIKEPSLGGQVRTNDIQELTLPIIGKPTLTRP